MYDASERHERRTTVEETLLRAREKVSSANSILSHLLTKVDTHVPELDSKPTVLALLEALDTAEEVIDSLVTRTVNLSKADDLLHATQVFSSSMDARDKHLYKSHLEQILSQLTTLLC